MTPIERVDELLDAWEDVIQSNPNADAEVFLVKTCRNDDPGVVAEVRTRIAALRRIDRMLPASPVTEAQELERPVTNLRIGSEPISGYRLVSRIAEGGFGEVWRASGPFDFPVAMKFVRLDSKGQIELKALRVAKKARHPHLISTHGAWQQSGHLIIAMELADYSLFDRLQEALAEGLPGIPPAELLRYIQDAAAGIDFLNQPQESSKGTQHRDIKPQNLLVVGGRVKVADFGISRDIEGTSTSHTGRLSLAYAAPEFFDGKTSSRSDQYSLAVTYYQLRTGRLPFNGSDLEIMRGHVERVPDLCGLPDGERQAVKRALSKNPSDRWPDCRSFVESLAESTGSRGTKNRRAFFHAERIGWIALSTLVATLVIAVAVKSRDSKDEPHEVTPPPSPAQAAEASDSPSVVSKSDWLQKFPESVVTYELVSESQNDSSGQMQIRQRIDHRAYDQLVESLAKQLHENALTKGPGILGLPHPSAWTQLILRYDLSSTALTEAIQASLEKKQSSVVVVGRKLISTPWGKQDEDALRGLRGGEQILSCDWYCVKDSAVNELRTAFRRARNMSLTADSKSESEKQRFLPLFPYRWSHEVSRAGTVLLPGGPAGIIFSLAAGGGDLNFTGARDRYEKTLARRPAMTAVLDEERVLLLLPGFFFQGKFLDEVEVAQIDGDASDGLKLRCNLPSGPSKLVQWISADSTSAHVRGPSLNPCL